MASDGASEAGAGAGAAISSLADPAKAGDAHLLDYDPDSPFQCCVCLDILYKPIVLACGHISCFWCVHRAMHSLQESHCAICRQPYRHFPSICLLLHQLILKLDPVAYKRREKEVLNEERSLDVYSPQLPENMLQENVNSALECSTSPENGVEKQASAGVSISDVLCSACKEMLYQPVILNCGHAFCEFCLSDTVEPLECQVCESLHPGGFPNVCLDLDHFLEEKFPGEYESRKQHIMLEKLKSRHPDPSASTVTGSSQTNNQIKAESSESTDGCSHKKEDFAYVHVGVGCDSCGMYPIVGKRYKCKDCKEAIGFDLCEACYNTTSKLPGRFNQQHTPDHQFELDDSQMFGRIFRLTLPNDLQQYYVAPEDLLPIDDAEEHDDHVVVLEDDEEEEDQRRNEMGRMRTYSD